ncbi:MAG TPA: glutamine synthetase family protein [Candidatus Binataceae bacterium]|nr:glutamine synthetase family protein [Candidatus Binataceae bacterium]
MSGPDQVKPSGLGRPEFVERHALWTRSQKDRVQWVRETIEREKIDSVRVVFGDQHGIARGKTLTTRNFLTAMERGHTIVSTVFAMDTTNHIVFPVFTADGGLPLAEAGGTGDLVMVPDPETFRVLPWVQKTAWVLADLYLSDGAPVVIAPRHICRRVLSHLHEQGFESMTGLEVEFHIMKMDDARLRPEQSGQPPDPPQVSMLAHGFQHLAELRIDEFQPILETLRENLEGLGLPIRSLETEWGPSQCEVTFEPGTGLGPADDMLLFRTAVKQICRRHGCHASFMCWPAVPNLYASGWHLHQSLYSVATGENAFVAGDSSRLLSDAGQHFVGGLLQHAGAACVFSNPTINGYKRLRPNSLAPHLANWASENRGAMIRVIGKAADPGTHLENRIGEPAANPYLYLAANLVAGMSGINQRTDPGEPTTDPYADTHRALLPRSLMEAVAALKADALFREKMGTEFIDYIIALKQAEIDRFLSFVTDWEQREYFEVF